MLDKALYIMMFMWSVSFSMLGGQYVVADVIGHELTNFNGDPIKSHILTLIDEDSLNETIENIAEGNFTGNTTYYDKIETSTTGAAFVAWEVVTLLSGTYIFNFMFLMGIPIFFVAIFVLLYFVLLGRAILGYINRV